ncbi:MAG: arsenate reductase ArsC [Pseudomonadota bacterium]
MSDKTYNALVLCTGNSARSILGEALLNKLGSGRLNAYSAGSQPKDVPNPGAIHLLERKGFDISFARSKSWDEFAQPDAPKLDFVFTVCDNAAGETCPIWPGAPVTGHWGIPDPADVTDPVEAVHEAFELAYKRLEKRIKAFFDLKYENMSIAELREAFRAIGAMTD